MFVLIYVASICLANLSVAKFGIWVTPINAFFLIGLELVSRDVLHKKISKLSMIAVVFAAGMISFLINAESKNIAIASFTAIVISCFVDYYVFSKTKGPWMKKSNTSNFFSGFTDSLIFPLVAFGVLIPDVMVMQWIAKFTGGHIWAIIISKAMMNKQQ